MLHWIVERRDGGWEVRSPAVGVWSGLPQAGRLVDGGSDLGAIVQGSRRLVPRLPADVRGVVVAPLDAGRHEVALEWGQTVFRIDEAGAAGAASTAAAQEESGGVLQFRAPTDGVFYAKPSPDSEAFVHPGSTLRRGEPIGLIEVMKTFNQVLYDADDLPDEVEVEAVLAADGTEVRAGEPLLRLRRPGQ